MNQPVAECGSYVQFTASLQLSPGPGQLLGIFVSSLSGATLKIWDSKSAAGAVLVDTFTPQLGFNPLPFAFNTGCFVTVAGTISATAALNPS